ncbi:hypothetical protein GCM10027425_08240 [Alteromonas gracilis]
MARLGPVALLGLIGSGLLALAGAQTWLGPVESASPMPGVAVETGRGAPAATALALVLLALWGVILVTRGGVRRLLAWGMAALAVLTAGVTVWAIVSVLRAEPDPVRDEVLSAGWIVTAGLAALLALVAGLLAARHVREWPEMSSRYDAPSGSGGSGPEESDLTSPRGTWRALDEGRDPTA